MSRLIIPRGSGQRLAPHIRTSQMLVTVTSVGQILVPPNPLRYAIDFPVCRGGTGFIIVTPALGQYNDDLGFFQYYLAPQTLRFVFCDHGQMVRAGWYIRTTGADVPYWYLDSVLPVEVWSELYQQAV